jgi:hypothetical protein
MSLSSTVYASPSTSSRPASNPAATPRHRLGTHSVASTQQTRLHSLQGIAYEPNINEPFTVTGGTGAYAVARGLANVNDVNETTVRFTMKLPA